MIIELLLASAAIQDHPDLASTYGVRQQRFRQSTKAVSYAVVVCGSAKSR